MAQWRERSPPTNVARVRFRPRSICGSSLLLVLVLAPRVFLRVLRFSSLHKNQHFQIPIRSGISGIKKSHLVEDPTVNSHLFLFIPILQQESNKEGEHQLNQSSSMQLLFQRSTIIRFSCKVACAWQETALILIILCTSLLLDSGM